VNVTANLLDILTQMVQDQLSMGDEVTSEVLMRVFARTAGPVWAMVGSWLKNGMPIRDPSGQCDSYGSSSLDDEFFIEDNDMVLVDPDFWKEGYTLRDRLETGTRARAVPVFLAHIAEHILSCGKTVGLLRVLDIPLLHDDPSTTPPPTWPNFAALLAKESSSESESRSYALLSLSTDRLSQVVHDVSWPYCQATGSRLTKALFEDFDALHHLSAIEDLYLMRRGDTMSHFADVLFAKVYSSFT
jgi:gamma-tubulin complex component 5